ncbi:MAG: ABC transporter permease [Methylococcales bacterium]
MIDSFYIAWKYVRYNRIKTALLVASLVLISFLPIALHHLLNKSEHQLMSRAVSTPLLVGSQGSRMDLVMNTLYFSNDVPPLVSMKTAQEVMDSNLAGAIPMYVRYQARGFPLIGTTLDYFDFRELVIGKGRHFVTLGECIIGAKVAKKYNLKPGDSLISSPQNIFDMAGIYPLKMRIVGVLQKNDSPDDTAVFADLKTTWIIEGLGHGHQDLGEINDESVLLESSGKQIRANAKLTYYNEITDQNVESFHFHGDTEKFPLTAVIAVPSDVKSETILKGRYLADDGEEQIVVASNVINGLLDNIFRVKNIIDAVILIVTVAMVLSVILIFMLSLRLRKREIETIYNLGCSQMTTVRLVAAEVILVGIAAAFLCGILLFWLNVVSDDLVRRLVVQ